MVRDTDARPRAIEDEVAATEARRRYRTEPMASVSHDAALDGVLRPGEVVLAVRRAASVGHGTPAVDRLTRERMTDMFLTSERLVIGCERAISIELAEIVDAIVVRGRLVLILRDGSSVSLAVERPRVLRVEIATARVAARPPASAAHPGPCPSRLVAEPAGGIGPVPGVELVQDAADVGLDGPGRDRQDAGDLAVGEPAGQ